MLKAHMMCAESAKLLMVVDCGLPCGVASPTAQHLTAAMARQSWPMASLLQGKPQSCTQRR